MKQTKLTTWNIKPNQNITFPVGMVMVVEKYYQKLGLDKVFGKHKKKGKNINALLLGYEELTGLKKSSSEGQTNGRSLFKIGAAGLGEYIASKIYDYNKDKNELKKNEFNKKINELHVNLSKDGSFSRYFNDSPSMMMDEVNKVISTSQETLNNGIKSSKVQNRFQKVVEGGSDHIAELRSYFANGVPDNLADFARDGYVTQQLQSLSSSVKNRAYTGIVLEGLAVAGAMAALLVPAELISKKIKGIKVKV